MPTVKDNTTTKITAPWDAYQALTTYFSSEFENIAKLSISNEPVKLDLLVQQVEVLLSENQQITEHLGDTFSVVSFGKSPLSVTISCILIDTPDGYNKDVLVPLYVNKLRLSAVARTTNLPVLDFQNAVLEGPMLNMQLLETSEQADSIVVTFIMMVFKFTLIANTEDGITTVEFNYSYGSESPQSLYRSRTKRTPKETTNTADPDVNITKTP